MGAQSRAAHHSTAARAGDRAGAVRAARPRLPDRHRDARRGVRESDYRRNDPRYQGANFDANVKAAAAVRALAAAKGATPGQVALAWLLHKGPDIVPIPGTKRRKYLEENAAAAQVVLSMTEMATLDAALAPDKIAGPRYTPKQQAMVDR